MSRKQRHLIAMILTTSACIVCLLLATLGSATGARPSSATTPSPSPAADLRDLSLTGDLGWAVGENGTILASVDGGATWAAQPSDYDGWLFGVAFTDASHGWAVGGAYGGTIIGTSDGGTSWTTQATAPGSLQAVATADATHAWAVGDGILGTSDGASWHSQKAPPTIGPLLDVCAAEVHHVWAVGHGGTIVGTSDGGSTWTFQHADPDLTLTAVSFVDSQYGWAAGYAGSGIYTARALLLATRDGGATWTEVHRSASQSYFTGVVRQDGLHGWAVGSYGAVPRAVFRTADGGATWRLAAIAAAPLAAVQATASSACVVGDDGLTLLVPGERTDTTPPASIVSGAGPGWRRTWTLRLSATDEGGSGVAVRQVSVGDQRRWRGAGTKLVLTSAEDRAFDGAHRVYYRSGDAAGNVERARFVTVRVDTRRPAVTCPARVEATTGQLAHLRYLVTDRRPCAGWATVTARFYAGDAKGTEHLVKVVGSGRVTTGSWHDLVFRCKLPRGTYIISLTARDAAGNRGYGAATLVMR